jgi:hypothetical protein
VRHNPDQLAGNLRLYSGGRVGLASMRPAEHSSARPHGT